MIIKLGKAHKLSRRFYFRGLHISIETDKGELRHWYDPHNKTKGTTKMKYPYGYIRRTKGTDGDHVDVYVGPNEQAKNVYVIHQMKAPDFKKFDEDKCMLGFNSAESARAAYHRHYNDKRFLGSITTMPFEEFEKKVLRTFDLKRPPKIAEAPVNTQTKTAYVLGVDAALAVFEKESMDSGVLNGLLNAAESAGGTIKDYAQKGYAKTEKGVGAALDALGLGKPKKKKPEETTKEALGIKAILAGAGLLGGGGALAAAAGSDKKKDIGEAATGGVSGSRTQRGLEAAGIGGY